MSKVSPEFDELNKMDQDQAGDYLAAEGVLDSDESSSDDMQESDTGLTENQNRLLYLIKLYTHQAKTEHEKEAWLKKQALMVLIYEGIVAQIFDYDYAPASDTVELIRRYFNVSQEGKSDVDFLREEELLNGLKLSSKSYEPNTCFQVAEKGEEVVKKIGKSDKEAVHELVYAPGTRELLKVLWNSESKKFELCSDSGYTRESTVTDTEDVSYVSSAYVPQCLRHGGRPTLSNAHRAHECGSGESGIRDELDEVITLNSVSIIVAEYIPFGANQVVQLNNNIGSTERVQGGFYTALQGESKSDGSKLEILPGKTSINILDYTLTSHVNFEADIHFPVDDGIVQVETFGVSVNSDGTVFYGMQVEAILDRIKDNISLDHLSRLLVDVHVDSSLILDSIVSEYQRAILKFIFMGDPRSRDKVNLIIANEVTPHLTAEEYMDRGEYENELKQVLGDTRAGFDISEHDTLIFGAHGLLVAGPNSRHHEPLLCSYLQFQSMDLFLQNLFSRMFLVLDDMKLIRNMIYENETDPNSSTLIRTEMSIISSSVILLEEVVSYLAESIDEMVIPPEPPEQAGRSLYERLEVAEMKDQLKRRIRDLQKNVVGSHHELRMLREMSNVVSANKALVLQEHLNNHASQLCKLQDANFRSSKSLEIVQVILAGGLAFAVLDRLTGGWTVVNTDWMRSFIEPMMRNTPMIWFFVNLLCFAMFALGITRFMHWHNFQSQGMITLRTKVYRPIDLAALTRFLQGKGKHVCQEDRELKSSNELVKVYWVEEDKREWGHHAPTIGLEYDLKNAFLLYYTITYNRREAKKHLAFNAEELREKIQSSLDDAGMFQTDGHGLRGIR